MRSDQPGQSSQYSHEQLRIVVERLTYHSEESGYSVARFKAPRTRELITIVGSFSSIQAGQTLQLNGFGATILNSAPSFRSFSTGRRNRQP